MINLTERETEFITKFLAMNGCGATDAESLLDDNFSCQCLEDLNESMDLTPNQIGGFLSSLQEKDVIWCEERPKREGPNRYWVNDSFLETLPEDFKF
jgi:hypothetical protein